MGHFGNESSTKKKQNTKAVKVVDWETKIAWMIYAHFMISDTDGTALEIHDLLKIEVRSVNVQTFDTKCDETIIAMRSCWRNCTSGSSRKI